MGIHFSFLNLLLRKAQMCQNVKFGNSTCNFSFWEITRERNEKKKKPKNSSLSKHKSSVISKKRIYLWPTIASTLLCLLIFFIFMSLCLINVMLNMSQKRYTQLAFYTQEKFRIERIRCASERPSLQGEVCLDLCQLSAECYTSQFAILHFFLFK